MSISIWKKTYIGLFGQPNARIDKQSFSIIVVIRADNLIIKPGGNNNGIDTVFFLTSTLLYLIYAAV